MILERGDKIIRESLNNNSLVSITSKSLEDIIRRQSSRMNKSVSDLIGVC